MASLRNAEKTTSFFDIGRRVPALENLACELATVNRSFASYPSPPIVSGNQMSLLFHLQNHRGKILLLSFGRLCSVDLESRACRGHLRTDSSCEVENQPKILVH